MSNFIKPRFEYKQTDFVQYVYDNKSGIAYILTNSNDMNDLIHLLNKQEQRSVELREQVKNAIVPKFTVGQEVWFIDPERDVSSGDIWKIEINCIQTLYTIFWGNECEDIYREYELFATKEEAEQKLKEMKSE